MDNVRKVLRGVQSDEKSAWVSLLVGNRESLRSEIELRLRHGHQSLVYNFFRTPPIDRDTLDSVPQGAAAFLAGSLNELASRYTPSATNDAGAAPVVTGLDIGREFFGNIAVPFLCQRD